MKHNITLSGPSCVIRPISIQDAEFIIELRQDEKRTRFMKPIPKDVASQERYLEEYFNRPNDYYFVVEDKKTKIRKGLGRIDHFDPKNGRTEWSSWIMKPSSRNSIESALLLLQVGFEILGSHEFLAITSTENIYSRPFLEWCGFRKKALLPRHIELRGRWHDCVKYELPEEQWPSTRQLLLQKASEISKRREKGA